MGIVNARLAPEILAIEGTYGVLTAPRSERRAKLWLIVDENTRVGTLTLVTEGDNALAVHQIVGEIESATRSQTQLRVTVDGTEYSLMAQSACCGTGQVGQAGPIAGRYRLVMANPSFFPWYEDTR